MKKLVAEIISPMVQAFEAVKKGWLGYLTMAVILGFFSESVLSSSNIETGINFDKFMPFQLSNSQGVLVLAYLFSLFIIFLTVLFTAWSRYNVIDREEMNSVVIPWQQKWNLPVILRLTLLDATMYALIFIGYMLYLAISFLVALLPPSLLSFSGPTVLTLLAVLSLLAIIFILPIVALAQIEIVAKKEGFLASIRGAAQFMKNSLKRTIAFSLFISVALFLANNVVSFVVSVFFETITKVSNITPLFSLLSLFGWILYLGGYVLSGYVAVMGILSWKTYMQMKVE